MSAPRRAGNLPYEALEELATHLIDLAAHRCSVALLVRAEWIVPKARAKLVRAHLASLAR
jgi:hypothetical protein